VFLTVETDNFTKNTIGRTLKWRQLHYCKHV